jgi:hypothetical protein
MPSYGFRLFEVQLRERGGHKPKDVSKVGDEHLAVYVERLLNARLKDRTLVGLPATESAGEEPPMDEAHRNKPGLRVEEVERTGHLVIATMYFGRYSDFARGLALPGGDDADLKDVAPSRPFRVVLNLPATGSPGVLVVEDIGRSTPTKMLIRWLKQASQDDAAERAATNAKTGEEEAVAASTWWRLALKPMADLEHLQELVAAGKLEKIHLIRRGYGRGNTPDKREMELSYNAITDKKSRDIAKLLPAWVRGKYGDDGDGDSKATDADAAKALAAVLGDDFEALGFDDGYVVLDDGGKNKPVSPSRLSDYFVYLVDPERQPSRLAFYEAARDTAKRIAKATGTTSVTWPSIV